MTQRDATKRLLAIAAEVFDECPPPPGFDEDLEAFRILTERVNNSAAFDDEISPLADQINHASGSPY